MSFCSALHPTVTSSGLLRSVTTKLPRRAACPLGLRSFSSYGSSNHSSKRKLQTATAYQPYSLLESLPPPARNSDSVSEASIVVDKNSMLGKWQSGSTNRPHPQPQQPESVESINKSNATSYPEVEAQVSKLIAPSSPSPSASVTPSATATATPPTSAQSLTPKKTRRVSKLKARKTAMHITPEAILHLRQLTDQPDPKLVRVGVKNRGMLRGYLTI
ncbi:iron-sulfur assembly protein [Histoplasma capsulatum H143]|uniref:Iron-sulfur assembly protein n=1 Tax=Ajellomyces capsulatus (strain H143) TaxID=544712 RepID=C6HIP6_AJECH|nr:iron-sulfur assembly protein [Histoplasma capsulatum H143]